MYNVHNIIPVREIPRGKPSECSSTENMTASLGVTGHEGNRERGEWT